MGPFKLDKLPFTEIPIPEQKYALVFLYAGVVLSFIYFNINYFRQKDSEKIKLDLLLCRVSFAISSIVCILEAGVYLNISIIQFVQFMLLVISGCLVGFAFSMAVHAVFSYRTNEEMKKLGLMKYSPSATLMFRYIIRIQIPLQLSLILTVVWNINDYEPPLNRIWWLPFLGSSFLFNLGNFWDMLLFCLPGKYRVIGLKSLQIFRPAMDIHEMDWQAIGIVKPKPYEQIDICLHANSGDIGKIKEYLANGGNPNVQDGRGWTPLMNSVAENHFEASKLILSYGADPNIQNWKNRTAICYAARYANIDLVNLLISHKATVNPIGDPEECSPLLAAVAEGHSDIVEQLLLAGADATVKTTSGKSCIDIAMENEHGEIARILRNHLGFEVSAENDPLPGALKWVSSASKRTVPQQRQSTDRHTTITSEASDWKLRIVEEPKFSIKSPGDNGKYDENALTFLHDNNSLSEVHIHVRLNQKSNLVQKYTIRCIHLSQYVTHVLNTRPELQNEPIDDLVTIAILHYLTMVHRRTGIIDRTGLFASNEDGIQNL